MPWFFWQFLKGYVAIHRRAKCDLTLLCSAERECCPSGFITNAIDSPTHINLEKNYLKEKNCWPLKMFHEDDGEVSHVLIYQASQK